MELDVSGGQSVVQCGSLLCSVDLGILLCCLLCLVSSMEYNILNWNVRGINNPAKRRAILMFLAEHQCNIVCLQEVKMSAISRSIVTETLSVPVLVIISFTNLLWVLKGEF